MGGNDGARPCAPGQEWPLAEPCRTTAFESAPLARCKRRFAATQSNWGEVLEATLNRRVAKCAQDGIDAGLIPRTLRFKPLQNILVDTKGNQGFRRRRLQTLADDSSDDVLYVGFGVFLGRRAGR